MLTTIKGYYEHGQIILKEDSPVTEKTEVIITFLTEEQPKNGSQKRMPGGLKGKVSIPDDFNEPIDDLKDYM
jgi:hypothetical protein